MTKFDKLVYLWRLHHHPYWVKGKIPYLKLPSWYTWKIQQQIMLHEMTIFKYVKQWIVLHLIIPLKGLWFCLHYYSQNGKVYNSLIGKYHYIHKEKGLTKYMSKPCCTKFCKQVEITYNPIGFPKWLKFYLKWIAKK